MDTNVSYTTAGLFVLGLIGFTVFAVIWLSAGLNTKNYTYYTVYMQESISGLSNDGPVEFNGVKVGTVHRMVIDRKNPQLVQLTLEVESDTPVSMGTRAKLGMRALTGVAFMLLEDKGADMRPIEKKPDQIYPVIPTVPSLYVRLDTTLTELNESFRAVSKSISSLLNKTNLENIQQILVSGKGSLQVLQTETLPLTNDAIASFGSMSEDLSEVTSEIKDNPSVILRGKATSRKLGPGE